MAIHPTAFVLTTAISLVPGKKPKRRKKRRRKNKGDDAPMTFHRTSSLTHIVPLSPKLVDIAKDGIERVVGFNPTEPQFRISWPQQVRLYMRMFMSFCSDGGDLDCLRDKMGELYPRHDWSLRVSEMGEGQRALWDNGVVIAQIAWAQKGGEALSKIRVSKGRFLVDPHVRDATVELDAIGIGDVVECIAASADGQDDERIYARVTKLTGPNGEEDRFEVTVLPHFDGHDVAPKRAAAHGFSANAEDESQSSRMFLTRGDRSGVVQVFARERDEEQPVDVSRDTRENRS